MVTGVAGKMGALSLPAQVAFSDRLDLRRFECVRGCGRCCGYKVSVLEDDITRLEGAGMARADFLDTDRDPAAGFAGCMRKRDGSCVLLDEGRRCRRYEERPLYCRLYPYVREAYVSIQLDVDLSCPGVGQGEPVSDAELAEIVAADDAATNHEAVLRYRRDERETAERLLGYRARQSPFDEIASGIMSAAEGGLSGLREALSSDRETAGGDEAFSTDAEGVLADYLVFWSRRQAVWRWCDAFAVSTAGVPSRADAMARFLTEADGTISARAGEIAGEDAIGADHVIEAIRECDSSLRTYCHSFRMSD